MGNQGYGTSRLRGSLRAMERVEGRGSDHQCGMPDESRDAVNAVRYQGENGAGVANRIESALDKQLEAQENEMSDLEAVRRKRIAQMQKDSKLKAELKKIGHMQYEEIADEKEFFAAAKKSEMMVCHFYRGATWRCEIVDKHLKALAPKCFKTRFVKINAEKCPFLVERLKVFMLPTMACVIKGQVAEYIVGFDDMGGDDDFPTEALAQRLSQIGVAEYEGGDILAQQQRASKPQKGYVGRRFIKGDRDSDDYDSSD